MHNCLEKKLSKDDFTRCLINTRKHQYKENNNKFKYNVDSVAATVYNTYKPNIKDEKERKILEIFDLVFNKEDALKITEKYMEEKGKTKQKKKNY